MMPFQSRFPVLAPWLGQPHRNHFHLVNKEPNGYGYNMIPHHLTTITRNRTTPG